MQHNMATWTSTVLLKNYEFKLHKQKLFLCFNYTFRSGCKLACSAGVFWVGETLFMFIILL